MPVKIVDKSSKEVGPSLSNALGVTPKSHFTVIKGGKVEKQDKEVLQGTHLSKDDAFEPYYFDPAKQTDEAIVLRPPFKPDQLAMLTQRNNTLGQLITAMEVNIDGTGWSIEKRNPEEDEDTDDDENIDRLTRWFEEPYPRTSMTTLRRKTRRDLEKVGYAFIEVLRAVDGTLMFLKRIDADMMRLVKLDVAVPVEETVERDGEEMQVLMHKRERRFAQVQGKKVVYFKEYGASRDLNRNTGEWADPGETLDAELRATEVLYFTVNEDPSSAYGVPRWINQIPSVLGSRKAEELNLDFFNSGGLPPALIFIQGGELTEEVRKQVQQYLSGRGSSIHRGGVIEVHSTGGSIDSPGNVRVTVERFGSERMQDSMFENYDERCELRVRSAFRLPPIFVGKSQDYSYATAFASYTVAEAQVFKPEREEFDEIINTTIMRELDPDGEYEYRSMGLTVNDVQTQIEAMGIVADKVERDSLIETVNEIAGVKLVSKDEDENEGMPFGGAPPGQPGGAPPGADPGEVLPEGDQSGAEAQPGSSPNGPAPPGQPQPGTPAQRAEKMDTFDMMMLVNKWCQSILDPDNISSDEVQMVERVVRSMDDATRKQFDSYAAMRLMGALDYDFEGGVELVGAAGAMMAAHEHTDDSA
jgi:PBSX family phage portal protein